MERLSKILSPYNMQLYCTNYSAATGRIVEMTGGWWIQYNVHRIASISFSTIKRNALFLQTMESFRVRWCLLVGPWHSVATPAYLESPTCRAIRASWWKGWTSTSLLGQIRRHRNFLQNRESTNISWAGTLFERDALPRIREFISLSVHDFSCSFDSVTRKKALIFKNLYT
jgi:hypothetical protein